MKSVNIPEPRRHVTNNPKPNRAKSTDEYEQKFRRMSFGMLISRFALQNIDSVSYISWILQELPKINDQHFIHYFGDCVYIAYVFSLQVFNCIKLKRFGSKICVILWFWTWKYDFSGKNEVFRDKCEMYTVFPITCCLIELDQNIPLSSTSSDNIWKFNHTYENNSKSLEFGRCSIQDHFLEFVTQD